MRARRYRRSGASKRQTSLRTPAARTETRPVHRRSRAPVSYTHLYTVGKTAEEVRASETTVNDHGDTVSADETLYAACTMDITGMTAVIAQAADYAR